MKENSEAMNRMIRARVGLITREPFFGMLALSKLELVEDPSCEHSWVDGRRLGFNPERVLACPTLDEVESIMAHHVATCALGHPFRRGGRDEKRWNEASDHCVNGYIQQAGFKLPEGSIYDPRFDGMYVEQIYSELQRDEQEGDDGDGDSKGRSDPDRGGKTGGSAAAPGTSPSPSGDDASEPGDAGSDGAAGDATSDGAPGGSPQSGAGASATGEVRDATADVEGAEDSRPASPAEVADQASDWETSVAQAAQAAKGAGRLAGGTGRLATAGLESRVGWREAFQRLLLARVKDDTSWSKPNKRAAALGMYLPTKDSPACGTLAAAIDYSGSTTQHDIDQFRSELDEARAMLNPERLLVMIFDLGVKMVLEFGREDEIVIPAAKSGGGTSFIEPVLKLEEMDVVPEALVFLTDLDSTQFAPEPAYPVIWVTTRVGTAPYGDVIDMI